jgi:flagellar biosynthesis protein
MPHAPAPTPAEPPPLIVQQRLREAVALEYGAYAAPVLTARAHGAAALRVVEEAQRHGVHVVRDPQLLAQLARVRLDEEIPPELYRAVAVLLAWAYWLRGMSPGDEKPQPATRPRP